MSIRLFNHYLSLPLLLLIALEALVATGALSLAMEQWWALPGGRPGSAWGLHFLFAVTLALSIAATGLYSARMRERITSVALRLGFAAVAAFLVLALLRAAFPVMGLRLSHFAWALGIAASADLLIRIGFSRVAAEGFLKARVLVYGAGWQSRSIAGLRRRSDRIGFQVVGYVPTESDREGLESLHAVDPGHDLLGFCRRHAVDEIVVAMDDRRRGFPVHELLQCRIHGIDVIELLQFLERETGKVRLDVLSPSWMIFSDGFRRTGLRDLVSRALDVLASLALLAVAWPIMVLVVLAIKVEDGFRAPVLYGQLRIGQDGRPFRVLKFRSMREDAEADGVARWADAADTRVTRIGAFLRKTRIDELPQLLNVLRGDMRFVGPRPERPEFVEQLEESIPYYRERHCVKPGLTGWAQLCYSYGSSEQDAIEKLQYDLYYIKNRSLLFDLAILLRTVEVVIFGKGGR
jgi:sugar transferase (PEP-CTERM system associated)